MGLKFLVEVSCRPEEIGICNELIVNSLHTHFTSVLSASMDTVTDMNIAREIRARNLIRQAKEFIAEEDANKEQSFGWAVGRSDGKRFRFKLKSDQMETTKFSHWLTANWFKTEPEAVAFLEQVAAYDPRGVDAGEYFIDPPPEATSIEERVINFLLEDSGLIFADGEDEEVMKILRRILNLPS